MTLFEAKMWRKIFTAEFLDMRWQKHKEQAPNLVLICEHFNNVRIHLTSCSINSLRPHHEKTVTIDGVLGITFSDRT